MLLLRFQSILRRAAVYQKQDSQTFVTTINLFELQTEPRWQPLPP